jgi:peptide/nickel transport system substrate-binding protein
MKLQNLLRCGVAAGALAALATFAAPASAATPADTLVMAWNIDSIVTFDPAQTNEVVTNEIILASCDMLVDYDPADESVIIPRFAKSWDVSEDGKTITFHLQEGAVFPSGNPVTAHDAAWSLQRVSKLGLGNAQSLTEFGFNVDTIEKQIYASDDNTLVFQLDRAYPTNLILQAIAAYKTAIILDSKTVSANETDGDFGNKYLATRTECVGPYKLARWNAGEVVMLEANETYWGDIPKLKRILIRHVAETGTQRLLVQQGDVDIARDLTPEDMAVLEAAEGVHLNVQRLPQLAYWNINNKVAPFDDAKTRLALRYLVDYDGLAGTVMRYIGSPRASYVQLGAVGALDEAEGQPFSLDLEKAKELLTEAGYPNGFSAKIFIGSHPFGAALAQSIQQNAAQIGVTFEIEAMANAQQNSRVRAKEFETSIQTWLANVPDAHGMTSRFVVNPDSTGEGNLGGLPVWRTGYHSAEMNALADEALFERDETKRAQLYREIQLEMLQTGPVAFLFQLNAVSGISNGLQNWTQNGMRAYYDKASK